MKTNFFYYDKQKHKPQILKKHSNIIDRFIRRISLSLPKTYLFGYFLQTISQLQILALILEQFFRNQNFNDTIQQDSIFLTLKMVCKLIIFEDLFDYEKANFLNSLVYILICFYFVLLLLISIVFCSLIFKNKLFEKIMSKIWGYLCILHHTLLCPPTLAYSLSLAFQFQKGKTNLFIQNFEFQFFCVTLILLGSFFSVIIALVMSKFCYHQLKVKDSMSMKNSTLQEVTLIFKIIMTIILTKSNSLIVTWIGVTISLLFLGARTVLIIYSLPFYNFKMANYYISWNIFILNITLLFSVVLIYKEDIHMPSFYYIFLLLFLASQKIIKNIIYGKIMKAMTIPYPQIASDHQIILKWLYLKRIFKKGSPDIYMGKKIIEDELFLQGVLIEHYKGESNFILQKYPNYIFIKNSRNWEKFLKENYNELAYSLRRLVLEIGIEMFPNSQLLKLLMAKFLIKKPEMYHRSIIILNDLRARNQNFEIKKSIYDLQIKIKKILKSKCFISSDLTLKEVNILELIKKEEIYIELNDQLRKLTKNHIHFWYMLIHNDTKIKETYDLVDKMIEYNVEFKKNWENMVKIYDKSQPRMYLIYGLFNLIVKNSKTFGENLLKTYMNFILHSQNIDLNTGFTDGNAVSLNNIGVLVSGQREDIGIIKKITHSVENHLGMIADDLKRTNVAILMPPYLKKRHDAFMLNFYRKNGSYKIFNSRREIYLLHKEGYIIPSSINLKYSPNIEAGVEFIAAIRPHSNKKNILIINEDGTIDSCSQDIQEILKLKVLNLGKTISIKQICPEFYQINKVINSYIYMKQNNNGDNELEKSTDPNLNFQTDFFTFSHRNAPSVSILKSRNNGVNCNSSLNNEIMHLKTQSGSLKKSRNTGEIRVESFKKKNSTKYSDNSIKALYQKYTTYGDVLIFYPFHENYPNCRLYFRCKTHIRIYPNNDIIKVLELEPDNINNYRSRIKNINSNSLYETDYIEDITPKSNEKKIIKYELNKEFNVNDTFEEEFPSDREKNHMDQNIVISNRIYEPKLLQIKNKEVEFSNRTFNPKAEQIDNKPDFSSPKKTRSSHLRKYLNTIIFNKRGTSYSNNINPVYPNYSISKTISNNYIQMRIEKALETNYEPNSLKVIYYGFACFYIFGLLLVIEAIINNTQGIRLVENERNLLEESNSRIHLLYEISRNTRSLYNKINNLTNISQQQQELLDDDLMNFLSINESKYLNLCRHLGNHNGNFQNNIHQINSDLSDKLYKNKIKFYDLDSNQNILSTYTEKNLFNAILLIATKCINLSNSNWTELIIPNKDINFILKYSLNNDILLGLQDSMNILAQDIVANNNNNLLRSFACLILLLSFSIGIYLLLIRYIYGFNIERAYFFKALLKLDQNSLRILIIKLRKFEEILSKNHNDHHLISSFNIITLEKHFNEEKTKSNSNVKKNSLRKAQFNGLNNKSYLILLIMFVLLSSIWIFFYIMHMILTEFSLASTIEITNSNYATNLFVILDETIISLNEYISQNGTTFRGDLNIKAVLENNLNKLNNSEILIDNFIDTDKENDWYLKITENFCTNGNSYQKEFCSYIPNSPAAIGIIGIINYLRYNINQIKDDFGSSLRSIADIKNALNSAKYFSVNAMFEIYVKEAILSLISSFSSNFSDNANNVANLLVLIGMMSIVLIGITAIISKIMTHNSIKRQGNALKAILKLLPTNMLLSNTSLKRYMLKTTGNALDSIKLKIQ